MKIECFILQNSREVAIKKINPKDSFFTFRGGLYLMNEDAINFYSLDSGKTVKGSEVYFFESNPTPIPVEGEHKDQSASYLDKTIYENVLDQTGDIKTERLKNTLSGLREVFTVGNVVKWGLILLIIGAAIGGQFGLI